MKLFLSSYYRTLLWLTYLPSRLYPCNPITLPIGAQHIITKFLHKLGNIQLYIKSHMITARLSTYTYNDTSIPVMLLLTTISGHLLLPEISYKDHSFFATSWEAVRHSRFCRRLTICGVTSHSPSLGHLVSRPLLSTKGSRHLAWLTI